MTELCLKKAENQPVCRNCWEPEELKALPEAKSLSPCENGTSSKLVWDTSSVKSGKGVKFLGLKNRARVIDLWGEDGNDARY
jgi:hypothetical protein